MTEWLASQAAAWIMRQQERYRPVGNPLVQEQRSALQDYFPGPVLDASILVGVDTIENPDFYSSLGSIGPNVPLIDFSGAQGITFADTILIRSRARTRSEEYSLVFHELVHSVQYSVLGIPAFAALYVAGWFSAGGDYARNPVEAQAYALQDRFETETRSFSVEAEVRQQLRS